MMGIVKLRVEGDNDLVKLAWEYGPAQDPLSCTYYVERAILSQQSDSIRDDLRQLATVNVYDAQYVETLRALDYHGMALRSILFTPDGVPDSVTHDLQDYIEEASSTEGCTPITVLLGSDIVHVPWGFVSVPRVPSPRDSFKLTRNIGDFENFWIGKFSLILKYQVNNSGLPKSRLGRHDCLWAVHEDLLATARAELRKKSTLDAERLDRQLAQSFVHSDWIEIKQEWNRVKDNFDSVIYVFGHSNGEKIVLKDDSIDSVHHVLSVAQFKVNFLKSSSTTSASIVILNGCRTAAPISSDPWPPSFLKATRGPGFYGFVGTEAEIPNDRACLYGAHLLERIRAGRETLGEAFDSLRIDPPPGVFPLSLVFTNFANRDFRLPPNTYRTLEGGVNSDFRLPPGACMTLRPGEYASV